MYQRDLPCNRGMIQNLRSMNLPQFISRPLLCLFVAITVFLAPVATLHAADQDTPALRGRNTERLTSSPARLWFGKVAVGQTKISTATLTNFGGSSISVSQATVSGAGFSLSGLDVPLLLTGGQSYTFTIAFSPRSRGLASGSIAVLSDASDSVLAIPVGGTGEDAGQLTVTPALLNFGNVTVGSSATLPGTLGATGSDVTIYSASSSDPEFSLGGLSFPFTIPAGQIVTYGVTFTPQSIGVISATLTFISDAANSPTVESLAGMGAPSAPETVNLSWNASTSQDVVGYNIYRGTASGGPYTRMNSTLDPSTVYSDNFVLPGQTYYYVTTAVDSNNNESSYSNQAQATIP